MRCSQQIQLDAVMQQAQATSRHQYWSSAPHQGIRADQWNHNISHKIQPVRQEIVDLDVIGNCGQAW